MNPVQAFLEAVTASSRQDSVSYVEFEEYYEGLSLAIEDDVDFINILHNTLNIWQATSVVLLAWDKQELLSRMKVKQDI